MPSTIGFPSGSGQPVGKRGGIRQSIDGLGRVEIRRVDATDGVAGIAGSGVMTHNGPNFNSQSQMFKRNWVISGVTKDSSGTPLGSCTVDLFLTDGDVLYGTTTSDASTGAYRFLVSGNSSDFYCVAYKAGSPDVAGVTVNTLYGVFT